MTIGEGLMEGRRWAMQTAGTNRPEGKGYVTNFASMWSRHSRSGVRLNIFAMPLISGGRNLFWAGFRESGHE